MAIDYDSGSGLFDKLGPVVSLVNALDTFETSTSAGNFEKEWQDLETLLEDSKLYDAQAKTILLQKKDAIKKVMWSAKQQIANLTPNLMASEMVDAEYLDSSEINFMLGKLKEFLVRDDTGLDVGTLGYTDNSGSYTSTGDIQLYVSVRDNNAPVDTSAGYAGVKNNNVSVEVIDQTQYKEKVRVWGNEKYNSGSPDFFNVGLVGTYPVIYSDSQECIIKNGSFDSVISGRITQWILASGAWDTDVIHDPTNYYTEGNSLKFSDDAKISQTIPVNRLKPYTKYILVFMVKKTVTGPDGTLTAAIEGLGASLSLSVENIATTWTPYSIIFNTPASPTDYIVSFDRAGFVDSTVWIDDVIIIPMTPVSGGYLSITASRPVVSNYANPIIGDYYQVDFENDGAGKFRTFFVRFYDFVLPSYGSSTIDDSLAA